MVMKMNKPWECPRCKRINAPFTPYCDCKPLRSFTDEAREKLRNNEYKVPSKETLIQNHHEN